MKKTLSRFFALLLTLVIAASSFTTAALAAPEVAGDASVTLCEEGSCTIESTKVTQSVSLPGDVNEDGSIDPVDALLILRYVLNIIDETFLNVQLADYNDDGTVDQVDALLVLRAALNIE